MPEPKDFRVGCDFYVNVALKAAEDLRRGLKIDEVSFRRIEQLQTDSAEDEQTRKNFSNMSAEKQEQMIGEAVSRLFRLQQKIIAESRAKKPDRTGS
jgi:hypothetical protein